MDTPIKLVEYASNDDGSVEISFEWNGQTYGKHYESAAVMIDDGKAPLQTVEDAARYLLGYWRTKDATGLDASNVLEKTLHIDPEASISDLAVYAPSPALAWLR